MKPDVETQKLISEEINADRNGWGRDLGSQERWPKPIVLNAQAVWNGLPSASTHDVG